MNNLKHLRTLKGITQKDVAEALGINRTTYVKYENGTSEPDHKMLIKLSNFFDTSIDYILGKTELKNYNNYRPQLNENEENDVSANRRILLIARKAEELPPEKREKVIDFFEETIDTYLAAMGDIFEKKSSNKKEDGE